MEDSKWYVVHTYSGYENKVKDNLEKTVENNGLEDLIHEVKVPVEEVVEIKNGKKRIVPRKIYPGYVLVKMVMTDNSWYVVRNTRGVTGFVGPGSKPIPLSENEIASMGVDAPPVRWDLAIGEDVHIMDGPLEGFQGKVEDIDTVTQKVKVLVSIFGRDTTVEMDYAQVKRA